MNTQRLEIGFLFACEVLCKLIAFGPIRFACDAFNCFDTVVVLATIPDLIGLDGANFSFLRILRLFRLLRSLKALLKIPSVRVLVKAAIDGAPDTLNFVLIFILFLNMRMVQALLHDIKLSHTTRLA